MSVSILIVTGQSGSGKSTAIRALEDQGYYCIDNMPVTLVEQMLATAEASGTIERVALGMDVRGGQFLDKAPALVARLRETSTEVRVVYLEARPESLLRRYSETRRKHPLDRGDGLRASIDAERELLAPMRELADDTIDTSGLSPHHLRAKVSKQLAGFDSGADLAVAVMSFGFKYGLPLDADIVLDVRFLPNPYFDPELKLMSGLDEPVRTYVLDSEDGKELLERTADFMGYLLPHFRREGKRYLTVAIGCTGGQHRSVAVAWKLGERLREQGIRVDLAHRDVKEGPA